MTSIQSEKQNPAAIILLCLIMIFVLVPVVFCIFLSFVDYQPAFGLLRSPAVGFRNYTDFLSAVYFPRIIGNSLTLWLASLLASLALGIPAAFLCSAIRDRRVAATCSGLFLLPAFIPAPVYFALALQVLPLSFFIHPSAYVLGFAAQILFPGASLIAFAGAITGMIYRSRGKRALSGALIGCLGVGLLYFFMSLMPNFEALQLSYNPLTYEASDTLDSFVYRKSLLGMQFGTGAAIFVIRSVLQILLAIIPAILLWLWLRKQRSFHIPENETVAVPSEKSSSLAFIPWVVAIAASIGLLLVKGIPETAALSKISANLTSSLFTMLIAFIIGGFLSLLVLFSAQRVSNVLYIVFTVILLATSNALIGQYLLARQFGMINTLFPAALTQWLQPLSLMLMLIFAMLLRYRRSSSKTAILLSASSACFLGAQAFGSSIPNMLYANTPSLFSMGLLLFNTTNGPAAGDRGVLALIYIGTLLPCLLLGFIGALFARRAAVELVK